MTNDKGILIKNIYYMLTYAFQVLRQSNYDSIAVEHFENIQDLFAGILRRGIAQQLKQGLHREYITKGENLTVLRGKLHIYGTLHNKIQRKQTLACEHDELSVNNAFNQILKTTALILLNQSSVHAERRQALKKAMLFFHEVDVIEPSSIQWSRLQYLKSNHGYKMLLNICYFVLTSLILTTEKGEYKMANFLRQDNMSRLYEKFVLEYYRCHHAHLRPAASQIAWNIEDSETGIKFLPRMQTDITLRHEERALVIDTKYYSRTMQSHYDARTLHSGNLYQIFTYVKNLDSASAGHVAGLILYVKTQETITPDCEFWMSGNKISVKTLDLNLAFPDIAAQLDAIAASFLGKN